MPQRNQKKKQSASTRSRTTSGDPSSLDKESLVERLTAQLRKLKKDELVSLVERVDSGTLDFTHLVTAGDGGFGFQERLDAEPGSDDADSESTRERLAESGPAQKAKDAIEAAKGTIGGHR